MHILLGFLAVVGVAVAWIWRARNAASAAKEVVEVADDVRAAVRRFGYRRIADKNPLDTVEDPRLSAAGILAAIAKMDGDYTREQMTAIQQECGRVFSASDKDAEQFTAYGRWLAQQSANPDEVVRRLSGNLSKNLAANERQELLGMVERVSAIEGRGATDEQILALKRLRESLG
ncbi:hypothetical protein [Pelagibius sp. Alg239-R121]|uniref:hypothetical protein n=1 Tax=Pelagibius sp. Alg239-R121 TaxID=2993448 RepID=UPI0024A73125|nr:hypothetical protein [Pelagibius sp. Alg239-R121]